MNSTALFHRGRRLLLIKNHFARLEDQIFGSSQCRLLVPSKSHFSTSPGAAATQETTTTPTTSKYSSLDGAAKNETLFNSTNVQKIISDLSQASHYDPKSWNPTETRKAYDAFAEALSSISSSSSNTTRRTNENKLLNPEVATKAAYALTRTKIPTEELSYKVRALEKLFGELKVPFTNHLSYALIRANGKAGNVGRVMQLLKLRGEHKFSPRKKEFEFAIQSILSNGVKMRSSLDRIYLKEDQKSRIDNPTRWLDEILINMHERDFQVTTVLANQMLNAYTGSGRTGRAEHFFYKMKSKQSNNNDDEMSVGNTTSSIVMEWNSKSPIPDHKVPSKSLASGSRKLVEESSNDWSLALTSAYEFANSLTHGACGHKPIELDLISWNTMMKVCVYRGALWRANQILKVEIPKHNLEPNIVSYNTMLHGYARVGDAAFLKDFLTEMTNVGVPFDKYTVQALTDGLLNAADISGAVTMVQDIFNQHSVLPPYTTQLKIMEFALSNSIPYEAKRHVDFIQQLWKWKPSPYHSEDAINTVRARCNNRRLSKDALQKLFRYYGFELGNDEFY